MQVLYKKKKGIQEPWLMQREDFLKLMISLKLTKEGKAHRNLQAQKQKKKRKKQSLGAIIGS